MIIAISGSGGFIGKSLSVYFQNKGYEVRSIPRISDQSNVSDIAKMLANADVIINLAGAPVVGRWTKMYKKLLFDSRIITTRKIAEAIGIMDQKPNLLISASAIGIYSQQGEQTEKKFQVADDYLGEICSAWELEAKKAIPFTRVVITRFGIVLGKDGGALKRMLPLFKLGLGGRIASGEQGFSWIHIVDVLKAMEFIIGNKQVSGEFNFTAPQVESNLTFTKILAKAVNRPSFFSVPAFALKAIFGEGVIAVAGGQFAPPRHLLDEGYEFSFPDLEGALKDITS